MTPSDDAPIIVIFGITGDLSKRKLLPALYHLMRQELLPPDTKIVGISRHELEPTAFLSTIELCVLEKDKVCDPATLQRMATALTTVQLHPDKVDDYHALQGLLTEFDPAQKRPRLFHMAIPAAAYGAILPRLAEVGLDTEQTRILLEKPFGYDVASAKQLLELVNAHFDEQKIYRIDHYLAKETVQNLLTFRMHNPIFMPLWSKEHVSRVHIRATETIGVEGRANFYEQTGALRDITQSHLMQLLALTMMDNPRDMSSQAIHDSKQAFFANLLPANPHKAVRAQYEGYRQEVNNLESAVETYARIQLEHQSERWQGTDIILETGKGMAEHTTTITMEFKAAAERRHNRLIFRLQPDEGISLDLVVKQPGLTDHMHHTSLNFDYKQLFADSHHVDAYERVLLDAIRGDQSLFASNQDVAATWHILQPILDEWARPGSDLLSYPLGSDGPPQP